MFNRSSYWAWTGLTLGLALGYLAAVFTFQGSPEM